MVDASERKKHKGARERKKHFQAPMKKLFLTKRSQRGQRQLFGWAFPFSPLSLPSSVVHTNHFLIISGETHMQIGQKQSYHKHKQQ